MTILAFATRRASILNSFLVHQRQLKTSAPLNFLFPKVSNEQRYKKVDGLLSNKYELTYVIPWPKYIQAAQHATTVCYLSMPFLFGKYIIQELEEFKSGSLIQKLAEIVNYNYSDFWIYASSYIAFCWAIRWIPNRIPLRIYRTKDECIAIFEGLLPFTKKRVHFQKGQLSEHFNAYNPFHATSYKIRNKKIILFPRHFKRYAFLHELLDSKTRRKYMIEQ